MSNLTILIIEHDPGARASYAEALKEQGYLVAEAATGREAEDYLQGGPLPAAIVLDLMMPRTDGWPVSVLKRQGHLPRVPLLVITTATDDPADPGPFNRLLRKPVDPRELVAAVRAVAGPPSPWAS